MRVNKFNQKANAMFEMFDHLLLSEIFDIIRNRELLQWRGNLSDSTPLRESRYLSESDQRCFNEVCGDLYPPRCFTAQLSGCL